MLKFSRYEAEKSNGASSKDSGGFCRRKSHGRKI